MKGSGGLQVPLPPFASGIPLPSLLHESKGKRWERERSKAGGLLGKQPHLPYGFNRGSRGQAPCQVAGRSPSLGPWLVCPPRPGSASSSVPTPVRALRDSLGPHPGGRTPMCPPRSSVLWGLRRSEGLTAASGPHGEVGAGGSFSCKQSGQWPGPRSRRRPGPGAAGPLLLTLPGPSGLSSRSMEEMLSRLFRRPMPAAKGLAMTPGDTWGGQRAKGGAH